MARLLYLPTRPARCSVVEAEITKLRRAERSLLSLCFGLRPPPPSGRAPAMPLSSAARQRLQRRALRRLRRLALDASNPNDWDEC
jgi:hypothetical protein